MNLCGIIILNSEDKLLVFYDLQHYTELQPVAKRHQMVSSRQQYPCGFPHSSPSEKLLMFLVFDTVALKSLRKWQPP